MKVSIITVCFNSEKTISDTIRSVLNQKMKPSEYIIVDGESTDKTLSIINSFEKEASDKGIRYKVISETDSGIYNAMNKGLRIAEGDVVGIINSDDWYEENAIQYVSDNFSDDIDLVYGRLNFYKNEVFHRTEGNAFSFLPEKMIGHPTCFLKKSVYIKFNFYDESFKCAADYDLMLKLYKNGIVSKQLDNVLANFRLGGITDSDFTSKNESLKIRRDYGFISRKKYYMKRFENTLKSFLL